MARNGSGVYSLPAPPSPFVTGQTASATDMMTVLGDIGSALTASTAADGQTPITGNWPFGGYNISGVGTLSATAIAVGNLTASGVVVAADGTTGDQCVNFSQFPTTLATVGAQALPGGLLLKWGTGATTNGVGLVSFAVAFPTACYNVQLTMSGGSGAATLNSLITATINTTGADVRGDAAQSVSFHWLAIGS